jgi:hypothetical protein
MAAVVEGRADRRRIQGQGIRTISANVSGLRWCVLLTAAAQGRRRALRRERPRRLRNRGLPRPCGPRRSSSARRTLTSPTGAPRSSNSRGQTALRGPDEKIPKKSWGSQKKSSGGWGVCVGRWLLKPAPAFVSGKAPPGPRFQAAARLPGFVIRPVKPMTSA